MQIDKKGVTRGLGTRLTDETANERGDEAVRTREGQGDKTRT